MCNLVLGSAYMLLYAHFDCSPCVSLTKIVAENDFLLPLVYVVTSTCQCHEMDGELHLQRVGECEGVWLLAVVRGNAVLLC